MARPVNPKLREVAVEVEARGSKTVTIQRLIQWYDRERRSSELNGTIREDLMALGLTTLPNFASRKWPLDRKIRIRPLIPKRIRRRIERTEKRQMNEGRPA